MTVPYDPNDPFNQLNASQNPNLPYKKKSKLWLWITIGILTPMLLCGLGIGGCTYFVVSKTKPAFNEVNKFYAALKQDKDVMSFECKKTIKDYGIDELNNFATQINSKYGKITSYDFNGYDNTNGIESISGTVKHEHQTTKSRVFVEKEGSKYKICSAVEY